MHAAGNIGVSWCWRMINIIIVAVEHGTAAMPGRPIGTR